MSCDVDGAPNAYHSLDDDLALDVLASAEGRRFSGGSSGPIEVLPSPEIVVYQNGQPYVQTGGEYAGFFVSKTSLYDPSRLPADPLRYLDSRKIQYIVLPMGLCPEAKLGDLAAVFDPATKNVVYAVYGDIGPSSESGEASLATLLRLGLNTPNGKSSPGEYRDDLFYVFFPGTSKKLLGNGEWPLNQSRIDQLGSEEFAEWGGVPTVQGILATDTGVGSIQVTSETKWIYDELSSCRTNGWNHTFLVGLPGSSVQSRLPCAPEIVLASCEALSAVQKEIEKAESTPEHALDSSLQNHLAALSRIVAFFPGAANAEGVSLAQIASRVAVLQDRLQGILAEQHRSK